MSVLEVFQQNADPDPGRRHRPDRAVPGRPRRPWRPRGARADPWRRPRDGRRGRPAVRDGAVVAGDATAGGLPIGVCLRTIRAEPGWWLESARRLDAAGYAGVWAWDHFVGQGDKTVPVVEGWTILAMAAAQTQRLTVGPFVLNVMNRHPAIVARMASTLQIASGGRLILGMGIGGAPREHAAYGIDFPEAPERVARLEEAVAVIRALWTGGPVTRPSAFYPLENAHAFPVPEPPPPIVIGGETRTGARLAAPDRRRLEHVRELRGAPADLPRGARGGGSPTRGPARHRRFPGPVVERRDARRQSLGHRAARDVGPLARGRRGRGHRPRPNDRRYRRPGDRDGRLVAGAGSRITLFVAPSPGDRPDDRVPRVDPCLCPLRSAGCGRRRAVRGLQSPRTAGRICDAGPRHRLHRGHGRRSSRWRSSRGSRSPGSARSCRRSRGLVARRRRTGHHADGDQRGSQRGSNDVPAHRSARPERGRRRVGAQPADRGRARP